MTDSDHEPFNLHSSSKHDFFELYDHKDHDKVSLFDQLVFPEYIEVDVDNPDVEILEQHHLKPE